MDMEKQHYHLIGIGGIGMGAVASLLAAQGHRVSGSDVKENDMTASLKSKGIDVFIGHNAGNVKGSDIVVYSSAIKEDNVERAAAAEQGITLKKRAQCLAWLMRDYVGITVAGAHGKTTTTSMISHMMMKAGLDPAVAVGGIINGFSDNANPGKGEYFVAELDESDGSFLSFEPLFSVLTNIDKEHLDYYRNYNNLIEAYRKFILGMRNGGMIWGYGEDNLLRTLLEQSRIDHKTYGFSERNDLWAKNIRTGPFSSSFECVMDNEVIGEITLGVPGTHNIANALAALGIGLSLNLSFGEIRSGLETYQGVRRRFQVLEEGDGILVIDDYAHHPTEITAALSTAKSVKKDRLVAVFQPHRYSRLSSLYGEFQESLADCDHLIITDIYEAGEPPVPDVTAENFYNSIKDKISIPCEYVSKDSLIDRLLTLAREGDLIISLGAGDISSLFHKFADILKAKSRVSA